MKGKSATISFTQIISDIMMILALLWLTISAPFVYQAQKELEKHQLVKTWPQSSPEENEDCNPFGNNTEEKAESDSNSLSEYLHYIDELSHLAGTSTGHTCSHTFSVYVAFHGEMLCPPPNIAWL